MCLFDSIVNSTIWSEGWESDFFFFKWRIYNSGPEFPRKSMPWVGKSANLGKSGFSYWFLLQSGWHWKESWRNQEQINHIPHGCRGGDKSAKKAVRKQEPIEPCSCCRATEFNFSVVYYKCENSPWMRNYGGVLWILSVFFSLQAFLADYRKFLKCSIVSRSRKPLSSYYGT